MSITGTEVSEEVRRQVHDENEARWSPAVMAAKLTMALHGLWLDEPSAFYTDEIVTEQPEAITETTLGGPLPVLDHYKENLVHRVASLILSENREAAGNALLADFHAKQAGAS